MRRPNIVQYADERTRLISFGGVPAGRGAGGDGARAWAACATGETTAIVVARKNITRCTSLRTSPLPSNGSESQNGARSKTAAGARFFHLHLGQRNGSFAGGPILG